MDLGFSVLLPADLFALLINESYVVLQLDANIRKQFVLFNLMKVWET